MPRPGAGQDYRPEIDSLRAYAAILVALSHWYPRFARFHNWGMDGVYVFFVISGFVITRGLLRVDVSRGVGRSLKSFYARRALRIWPAYYCSMAMICVLFPRDVSMRTMAWHAVFCSNILMSIKRAFVFPVHYWSISVEEQFYLLWPLAVFFTSRRSFERLCVALLFLAPASRVLLDHATGGNFQLAYYSLVSNADCLAAGAAYALYEQRIASAGKGARRAFTLLPSAGAVLFLAVLAAHGPLDSLEGTAVAMIALGLIELGHTWEPLKGVLMNGATRGLGRISYGFYLYQFILGSYPWADRAEKAVPPGPFVLLCFALTLAASLVSWYALEKPFLRWKNRLTL